MTKKKRQRTAPNPLASIASGEAKSWYKKAWIWVTAFALVVSWVLLNGVDALSNAEKLPAAISSLYAKVSTWYRTDQEWTGKWSNEGEVDIRFQPDAYVDIDLLVQDGSVQGTISSQQQRDDIPLQFVLIEGAVVDDVLDVLAFDYVQGVRSRIATFKITRVASDGLDQIKVVTTWQALPWFPEETTMWRVGSTELLSKERANEY